MSFTVDRLTDQAVVLREVGSALVDPHQTGYRVTAFGDLSIPYITTDESEYAFLMAAHHLPGSFVPAVLEDSRSWLVDLLSSEWMLSTAVEDEEEVMAIPPLYTQRVTLRIRDVYYGLPSPIAFED